MCFKAQYDDETGTLLTLNFLSLPKAIQVSSQIELLMLLDYRGKCFEQVLSKMHFLHIPSTSLFSQLTDKLR